jgi:hypothetical protein
MKDQIDISHGLLDHFNVRRIALNKLDLPRLQMLKVAAKSRAEVV